MMEKNLPKGWTVAKIGDNEFCTLIMGQSPPGESYNDQKIGLPFYQGKSDFGLTNPKATVWCNKPTRIAEPNDILLCVRAPVGPTNIANEKCCIGRGLAIVRSTDKTDFDYLNYVLRKFEIDLAATGSGSVFDSVGKDELKAFKFPIPKDKKEQKRISKDIKEKLTTIDHIRLSAHKQKDAVESLQGALLREVFPYKEGDKLPEGWRREKLEKIFEEVKTLPFIGLENVVSHSREYTDEEYNPPSSTCFRFDESNVLYGKLRPYLNKVYLPTT